MYLLKSRLSSTTMLSLLEKYFRQHGKNISLEALNEGYAPAPERVYISLNRTCQCNCVMCANSRKEKNDREFLDKTVLEDLIKELSKYGTFFVFYRQEPLLYPNFSDSLDLINKYEAACQITTNGLLLGNHIEDILTSNVKNIWVSIDGPEGIHDRIRNYKNGYRISINNLFKLQEARKQKNNHLECVGISTSCHKYNYLHLTELANIVAQMDIDKLIVNQMRFCTESMCSQDEPAWNSKCSLKDDRLDILDVDAEKYMEIQHMVKKILGDKVIFNPEFKNKQEVNIYYHDILHPFVNLSCISSWMSCDVGMHGEIILCNVVSNFNLSDQQKKYGSFMERWNSKELRAKRKNIIENTPLVSCGRCSHLMSIPNIIFSYL